MGSPCIDGRNFLRDVPAHTIESMGCFLFPDDTMTVHLRAAHHTRAAAAPATMYARTSPTLHPRILPVPPFEDAFHAGAVPFLDVSCVGRLRDLVLNWRVQGFRISGHACIRDNAGA